MKIPDEVIEALERAQTQDTLLRLPDQLAPDLYRKVDKALKALGGRWDGTKHVRAHRLAATPPRWRRSVGTTGTHPKPERRTPVHGFTAAATRLATEIGVERLLTITPEKIHFHNHLDLTKTGQNGAAWTVVYLSALAEGINRDSLISNRSLAARMDAYRSTPSAQVTAAERLALADVEQPTTINLTD